MNGLSNNVLVRYVQQLIHTHMLLYLMMEPTITAVPPIIANTEPAEGDVTTKMVSTSKNCDHSSHMGKQVEFSR